MELDNNYDSKIGNLFPKNIPNDYFFISDWDLHNADFSIDSAFFYSKLYAKANYRTIFLLMSDLKKNYG